MDSKRPGSGTPETAPPRAFMWKSLAQLTFMGREAGLIGPDDEFVADIPVFKHPLAWAFLGPVHALFQRRCVLLVTPREVIVTPWAAVNNARPLGAMDRLRSSALHLARPQQFALAEPPKKSHTSGNKVQLPPAVAEFLGGDVVYAGAGLMADDAFQKAGTPPTRSAEEERSVVRRRAQQGELEADWYPDPTGQKRLRYYDGKEWTEHVAD